MMRREEREEEEEKRGRERYLRETLTVCRGDLSFTVEGEFSTVNAVMGASRRAGAGERNPRHMRDRNTSKQEMSVKALYSNRNESYMNTRRVGKVTHRINARHEVLRICFCDRKRRDTERNLTPPCKPKISYLMKRKARKNSTKRNPLVEVHFLLDTSIHQ
jgi:hypothetical protein